MSSILPKNKLENVNLTKFLTNILTNFDFSADFSLTCNLLTVSSFRIGVHLILIFYLLGTNVRDFHFEATILSILYILTEKLLPTCTTVPYCTCMAQQLQLEYLMSLFIEQRFCAASLDTFGFSLKRRKNVIPWPLLLCTSVAA